MRNLPKKKLPTYTVILTSRCVSQGPSYDCIPQEGLKWFLNMYDLFPHCNPKVWCQVWCKSTIIFVLFLHREMMECKKKNLFFGKKKPSPSENTTSSCYNDPITVFKDPEQKCARDHFFFFLFLIWKNCMLQM